jgi:hypothetical protein
MNGDNSYTGTTTITGGTLLVNNASGTSATGSSAVTVTGGTLGGNGGTISGTVGVTGPGHLTSGTAATAGTLNLANTLAFNTASNFDVQIGGTTAGTNYDQVLVGGAATIGANANITVNLINGFTNPASPTDFTVLTAAGGLTGTFLNVSVPDGSWSVTYNANSIVIHAAGGGGSGSGLGDVANVPEPAAMSLLIFGLSSVTAAFSRATRRRRR